MASCSSNFSFASWYSTFQQVTIPSKIITVPDEFIAYLKQDGLHLPPGIDDAADDLGVGWSDGSSGFEDGSDDEDQNEIWIADFKRVVHSAIEDLGGNVFPKLNWSSPRDARWIAPNRQLKCSTLAEIMTLFKASDFIAFDVAELEKLRGCQGNLVLRKWTEMNPGWEFRCFVKDGKLIGISQRYTSSFYPFIAADASGITGRIQRFYESKIAGRFPERNFVFDIIINNHASESFQLIDFNMFSRVTDPILFSWEELEDATEIPDDELLRFVTSPVAVRMDEMRQYEIPSDFAQPGFSTGGKDLFEFMRDKISEQHSEES